MNNLPHIFANRQFRIVAGITATVTLILVIMNIFVIGGDLFLFNFNSALDSPLAIMNAIAAASIWRLMSAENHNRVLWSGIITGWALWTLAETIWAVSSFLGQEVPYPSLADLFWVIGYIPMGIGLVIRARTMPTKPTSSQTLFILLVSVTTILITVFAIFIPIVQDFDAQLWIQSALNLIYPLFDLVLVTIVWRLFFTFEEGDYAFGWRLLTLGFLCMAISDFIFTYATWQEIYYPDMLANGISRIADVTYTLSYLLWFTGVYALAILSKEKPVVEPIVRVRVVRTYGHILVYTKSDNTVMDISPNFERFFEDANVIEKSFADALTLSEQNGRLIMEKLRTEGKIADLPIQVRNRSGASQEIRLSGVAITNSQKGYLGANILLRLRVMDESFDDVLDNPSKAMAKYLLDQSGSNNQAEIAQFLSDYYLAFIKALLNMASHVGGTSTSQELLNKLQTTAEKHDWQIQFNPQTVLDHTDYSLEVLREALPLLLETAKQFVSNLVEPASVKSRMEEVNSQFSETVRSDIERYAKVGSEIEFSNHRKGKTSAQ